MRDFANRFLAYCLSGLVVGFAVWFAVALMWQPPRAAMALAIGLIGVIGAILLLLRTGNVTGHEQETQSRGATWASDILCLVGAAVAGFFIMDGFTERLGLLPSIFDEPLAADVIAFMFLPATAILAWFVTQSASQTVAIDAEGLRVSRFGDTVTVSWPEIEGVKVESQYVLVSRVGTPMPRKLRTNLIVKAGTGDQITIIDPASKSGRQRLMARMKQFAPERLREALFRVEADWC